MISPLRYGEDAVGVALAAIEHGMPINAIIAAQSGATAPAPLAGRRGVRIVRVPTRKP